MKHFFRHHKFEFLFFFVPWGMYFLFLWSHMLFFQNGNLMVGHPYVWADWSMHIALASNFAFRPVSHWFDSLPVYAGAPVTYPFATNLISGLLWKVGFSLPFSFLMPSIVMTFAMLGTLYGFAHFLLRSKKKAILAATIFLCSGGLGFFLVFMQKGMSIFTDSTQILTQDPAYQLELNSVIPSMFIPQRAFLLGFPIGIVCLWMLCREFLFQKNPVRRSTLIATGTLVGVLPIIHTHTFLVLVFFSCWLCANSVQKFRSWLYFGLPGVFISTLVYVIFLRTGVSTQAFFSYRPGWAGSGSLLHWCLFWLKNWGLFLPVALIGTVKFYTDKKYEMLKFIGFFWCLFLIANIVQFQPQQWDNTKLFAWVYFGLSIAVTSVIAWVAHTQKKLFAFMGTVMLIFILCISGAIDLIHNLDFKRKTFELLSRDQIVLGEYVRAHTDTQSVFLTRPIVSNPISMIGGRSVYLGYPGWAFSYGLDYSTRESIIHNTFDGKAALESLRMQDNISYVCIEKNERDADWIERDIHSKKIFDNDAGTIYSIR